MPRELSLSEAKQRAGRFCAFRERSPQEVIDKLAKWGVADKLAIKVVGELMDMGYLDEQRFANAYCNDKFEFNSWGKNKIVASIHSHRLSQTVIENALTRIDPEKYERRLLELGQNKWVRLEKESPMKRKQKTVAFLASKGFELDLIWRVIEKLEHEKGQ